MKSSKNRTIQLSYSTIKRWEVIAGVTLISTLVVVGIYYLHPSNIDWYNDSNFSLTNLFQFVFIDQFLIELLTTFIISLILGYYAKKFKINSFILNFKGIALFFLKFIPLYFIAYFFTSPVTVSIRYVYHSFITQQEPLDYFESYFFLNRNLYVAYLLPIAIICTLLLATVIIKSISTSGTDYINKLKNVPLKVKTTTGEKLIGSNKVSWIFREGRKYFVNTDDGQIHQINKSLATLQEELDVNFVFVNRRTLINLQYFEDYSFWENEKYVVRMKDGTEFNSTRIRIKDLNKQTELYEKLKS